MLTEHPMQKRKVGLSNLEVSALGLGTWLTVGQAIDRRQSENCIAVALDNGINFFDTADVYGNGDAERFLGTCLSSVPRDQIVIATKCYFPIQTADHSGKGLSRKHIFASVENSLRNLRINTIDLMQCHRFDSETPVEESVQAMSDLVREGKIRYWGVSRWSSEQCEQAITIAAALGGEKPISNQCPYNLLNSSAELTLIPRCRETQMSFIAYSPLAQGVLTGKYVGNSVPSQSRASNPSARAGMWDLNSEKLMKATALLDVATEFNLNLASLALAWCMRENTVASTLMGASRPSQIESNVSALEIDLSSEILERISVALQ